MFKILGHLQYVGFPIPHLNTLNGAFNQSRDFGEILQKLSNIVLTVEIKPFVPMKMGKQIYKCQVVSFQFILWVRQYLIH